MLEQRPGSIGSLFGSTQGDASSTRRSRFHLERETEENVRRGMSPGGGADARPSCDFGGVEKTKEEIARGGPRRAPRDGPPGRPLRPALAAQEPGLRRRGGPDAGPRASARTPPSSRSSTASCCSRCPYGGGRAARAHPRRRARRGHRRTGAFSPPEIADLQRAEPHARRRRRVPLDVVRAPRQGPSPSASRRASSRRNFFDLLGVTPILGPDVPAGRGQARRRGRPRPVPRLLDAEPSAATRRSWAASSTMNDRPAHRHRRPAADPRLPRGQRRLHADLGVSVPLGPGDGERPRRRDARAPSARLKPGVTLRGRAQGPRRRRRADRRTTIPKNYPASIRLSLAPCLAARGADAAGAADVPAALRRRSAWCCCSPAPTSPT